MGFVFGVERSIIFRVKQNDSSFFFASSSKITQFCGIPLMLEQRKLGVLILVAAFHFGFDVHSLAFRKLAETASHVLALDTRTELSATAPDVGRRGAESIPNLIGVMNQIRADFANPV